MGEELKQVPSKHSAETLAWIDEIRSSDPHKPGRSTVIRYIVERFRVLVMSGIVPYAELESNRVLGNLGIPKFPPARQVREGAGSAELRKPDRPRVIAFSRLSNRRLAASVAASGAYESTPFPARVRRTFAQFSRGVA